jgi:hypothetical protein
MIKYILGFFLLFTTTLSYAQSGSFVGLSGSLLQQRGDDDGGNNNKLKGNGFGLYIGQRFRLISGELLFKSTSADVENFNMDFKYSGNAFGGGVRLHLSYFSLKVGVLKHNAKVNMTAPGGVTTELFKATGISPYVGLGLAINFIGILDVFFDYSTYKVSDDEVSSSRILFSDFELGVRLYF